MSDKDFCIADLSVAEKQAVSSAEAHLKASTGKDYVIIAWEKDK